MTIGLSFFQKKMFVKLSDWQPKHIKQLSEIANNEKIANAVNCKFPFPYTKVHAENWIKYCQDISGSQDIFEKAILIDNNVAGGFGTYFSSNHDKAKIGYWLGEKFWNYGIMTSLTKKLIEVLKKYSKVKEIYTLVWDSNIGSKRVLEKNGFLKDISFVNNQNCDSKISKYIIKIQR